MASSPILETANNRNQLYLIQYSSGEYEKFKPLFDELEEYLIDLINKNPEKLQTAKGFKELQSLANKKIEELILSQNIDFIADYELLAKQQAEFVELSLNRAVLNFTAVIPSISAILREAYRVPMVLGNTAISLDELSQQITTETKKNVRNALYLGYADGRTSDQIIASLRGDKEVKGAIPQSRLDTERVVRTALNHVATTARQRTNRENKKLVIGYRWLSTLDSRTSPICRDRDGEVYLYSDDFNPIPPAHYFCRSTTTQELNPKYKIKGLDEGRTRSSKGSEGGKQVSSNLNYYEWLKTQPASFQDEALGRTRGLIFRNSGLSIDEFKKATVNQFGQTLTIEQMTEKNNQIAEYLDDL